MKLKTDVSNYIYLQNPNPKKKFVDPNPNKNRLDPQPEYGKGCDK
jgi:hypothetical protein